MIIAIIIVFVLILLVFIQYNQLTKLKLRVEQSKSGIDVYLQQRFDLIPNLVNTVKSIWIMKKKLLKILQN